MKKPLSVGPAGASLGSSLFRVGDLYDGRWVALDGQTRRGVSESPIPAALATVSRLGRDSHLAPTTAGIPSCVSREPVAARPSGDGNLAGAPHLPRINPSPSAPPLRSPASRTLNPEPGALSAPRCLRGLPRSSPGCASAPSIQCTNAAPGGHPGPEQSEFRLPVLRSSQFRSLSARLSALCGCIFRNPQSHNPIRNPQPAFRNPNPP